MDDWPIKRLISQFVDDINYDSFMVKPYYYWHVEPDLKKGESPKNFKTLQSSLLAIFSCGFS
jgi:hypothetical protein